MRRPALRSDKQKASGGCIKSANLVSTTTSLKKGSGNGGENCQKFALKSVLNVFLWHASADLTFIWSSNKLARAVTKWTRASDKRSARLISYIHYMRNFKQYRSVSSNTPMLLVILRIRNRHGSALWCIFGSRKLVPIIWTCEKADCRLTQYHGVRRQFFSRRVYGWVVFLLLFCWIWSSKCYILQQKGG